MIYEFGARRCSWQAVNIEKGNYLYSGGNLPPLPRVKWVMLGGKDSNPEFSNATASPPFFSQ
jgi:hypothetical protein